MIARLIESSPYAGLLVVLWASGLGLPVPEEVPVVTAGVLAHRGVVRWWLALAVCLGGVLSADVALYWAGRRWGDRVLEHPLLRRLLDPARRDRLAAAYRRRGVAIVFAARHVMGLRSAAFLTAGIARVPFWRFLAADGAAAGVGIPLNFALAYLFTDHIHALMEDVRRVERWIGLLVLLAAAGWLGAIAWRRSRRVLSTE
jgi:membrane protein DedA with SNARE-associated domain